MNTLSHLLIGRFLCKYVQNHYGIILDKNSFIFGNILPDCTLSFVKKPHFPENYITYIQNEMTNLLSQKQNSACTCIGQSYSKHLGIICHYYADFFCFVHNNNFIGNMYQHVKYERCLHQYFLKEYAQIERIDFISDNVQCFDVDSVFCKFEKLHTNYLSLTPSYGNDLIYAILVCVEAIVSIASISVIDTTEKVPLSICYFDLKASV